MDPAQLPNDFAPRPSGHYWINFRGDLGHLIRVPWLALRPGTWAPYLRDKEWAMFTLQSWADNIKYPWQWDNNAFLNNQFSHPYHGNLYFNSARTNGYWLGELSGAQTDARHLDVIREIIPGTEKVTAADVKRAAEAWLKPENAYRVVVRPAPGAAAAP